MTPLCPDAGPVSSVVGFDGPSLERDNQALATYRPPPLVPSLDPDETSRRFDRHSLPDGPGLDPAVVHQAFRHSGWADRRARVLRALQAIDVNAGRIERFTKCGTAAWVLRSKSDPTAFRLATNRCRDRFCIPCALDHQRVVSANIVKACDGRQLRFITLTLRSTDRPLQETIDRLLKSFNRLRRTHICSKSMVGGIYFLEITLGTSTGLWHPHLHVLVEGSFIPQKLLADEWLSITGDSYIVDIRALRDSKAAAGYVAKYAGKALSANVINDPDHLREGIVALAGRRVFSCFGTWVHLNLSKHPESAQEWETVGTLAAILADARAGNVSACAIVRSLGRSNAHDPLTLFDEHPP